MLSGRLGENLFYPTVEHGTKNILSKNTLREHGTIKHKEKDAHQEHKTIYITKINMIIANDKLC